MNPVNFHRDDDHEVWGVPGRSEDGGGVLKPGKRIRVARDRSCPGSETGWGWREIAVLSMGT